MEEFREIAHCGGKVFVTTETTPSGTRRYSFGIRNSRPYPASIFAIAAWPQGVPAATTELGWTPDAPMQSKAASTFTVFIGSDRSSCFGHQCSVCNGYWRSTSAPSRWKMTCPYCGNKAAPHELLTDGQLAYVEAVCEHYQDALFNKPDGEHAIDFDAIADEVAKGATPPPFYYAEKSQQCSFKCHACSDFSDILGHFGYCSCCGTRNNLTLLRIDLKHCAEDLASGRAPSKVLGDIVSHFEGFGSDLLRILVERVPMTDSRRSRSNLIRFHDIKLASEVMKEVLDIDPTAGLDDVNADFAQKMFLRRHVYEHNAGVVDERYLTRSCDTSVRIGQALRESKEDVGRLIGIVGGMSEALHHKFHEVIKPDATALRAMRR